jgi:hypothetical protein
MKRVLKKIINKFRKLLGIDNTLMLMGKLLIERNRNIQSHASLNGSEFRVFSQWGEDGIIQFLIQRTKIPNRVFIEFGVEDYTEANTRFLMINDNWSGLVIDSSRANVDFIKQDDIYWRYDLRAICSFVNKDNINQLISQNVKERDIGLLVIDIDGNDYWVWKAIDAVNPRIVVCEYNGIFGCEHFVTVPYDERFIRDEKHYSNLYWGASLPALCLLAEEKGYVFVGCNSNGNNAFFIRKDICTLKAVNYKEGFVMPKFRESRNRGQQFTYFSGAERVKAISDMEVFDIKLNKNVLINDILEH